MSDADDGLSALANAVDAIASPSRPADGSDDDDGLLIEPILMEINVAHCA